MVVLFHDNVFAFFVIVVVVLIFESISPFHETSEHTTQAYNTINCHTQVYITLNNFKKLNTYEYT